MIVHRIRAKTTRFDVRHLTTGEQFAIWVVRQSSDPQAPFDISIDARPGLFSRRSNPEDHAKFVELGGDVLGFRVDPTDSGLVTRIEAPRTFSVSATNVGPIDEPVELVESRR